jgi:CHAD domain-containing protein
LELFYPLVPKGSKTELRKSVRSLTRILGGLRNIDEAQLFFASRTTTDVPVQKQLCNALSKLRADELKRIKRALKSFDHRHLDRIVREMVAGLNDVAILKRNSISLVAYFSEVSIRLFMPIHQLLAGSTVAEHRQLRHSLRIAVKKWRYFFEIIATIMERDYAHFLELLKEYQTVLGRMNDIAEFGLLLRNMKLPTDERDCATAALLAEEESLLKNFTELTERKPLGYTFLI